MIPADVFTWEFWFRLAVLVVGAIVGNLLADVIRAALAKRKGRRN